MTRLYDMRRRTRAADATRARIIQAAHELLNKPDGGALALQDVADVAGVSRATIYNRVGSRRDLLVAVFEDQGRLIEYDRVLEAMQLDDPTVAVTDTVLESCRAWSVIPAAIRKTLALAVVDPEIGQLVKQYEGYRREEVRSLAKRAIRRGGLGAGLRVEEATATLALLTGFPAFDHLRLEYDEPTATAHLVRTAWAALGITPNED